MPDLEIYPDVPNPIPSLEWDYDEGGVDVIADGFESGVVYARRASVRTLYSVRVPYGLNGDALEESDLQTVYEFYLRHRRVRPFVFYDFRGYDLTPVGRVWPNLYAWASDGAALTVDLPAKDSTDPVLSWDGTDHAEGDGWSVTLGGGSDGVQDLATLDAPVAKGSILRYTARCRRRIVGRFRTQRIGFKNFVRTLVTSGVEIEETVVAA